MGLDMYLYAEKRIDQYDYINEPNGKISRRDNLEYDKINAFVKSMPTGEYGGITISKCVAYWRKANAVHGWIVRELANGVDKCQRIDLDRDDLIRLRDACLIALADRDKALPHKEHTRVLDTSTKTDDEIISSIMEAFKNEHRNMDKVSISTDDNPIPPTSGFFFGGTNKDEYYYEYLANTAETISAILASDLDNSYSYYYQASW